jgi:O-antigen/teichoic acid export membrane protein
MNLSDIKKSSFLKSVATLLTGSALAQLIAFSVYPVVTRIYSNAEMGEFSFFSRWVLFFAAIATFRFEIAIPYSSTDQKALLLLRLCKRLLNYTIGSLLIIGSVSLFFLPFSLEQSLYFVMALLSIYFLATTNLGVLWSIRNAAFKLISRQQILSSSVSNSLKVVFGWLSFSSLGLMMSSMLGYLIGMLYFRKNTKEVYSSNMESIEGSLSDVALENKKFPMINLPQVLIEYGTEVCLAIMIVATFGKGSFGSYSMAYLILKIPIGLLGLSMSQVYQNRAVERLKKGQEIYSLTLKNIGFLILLSLIPFTVLLGFGDDLFAFLLGEDWRFSGEIAQIIAPFLAFNFILSPISSLPQILSKQGQAFVAGLLMSLFQLSLFAYSYFKMDKEVFEFAQILKWNTWGMCVILSLVLLLYLYLAKTARWSNDMETDKQEDLNHLV